MRHFMVVYNFFNNFATSLFKRKYEDKKTIMECSTVAECYYRQGTVRS